MQVSAVCVLQERSFKYTWPSYHLTHAALLVGTGYVAGVAGAVVAALDVDAAAVVAHARLAALVGVDALVGGVGAHLAVRTPAVERAGRVDTLAALAQTRDRLALVNICRQTEPQLSAVTAHCTASAVSAGLERSSTTGKQYNSTATPSKPAVAGPPRHPPAVRGGGIFCPFFLIRNLSAMRVKINVKRARTHTNTHKHTPIGTSGSYCVKMWCQSLVK